MTTPRGNAAPPSARFRSKTLRSIFDLGDLYASLNDAQRERLMSDIRGGLDLWAKQPAHVRWFFRLCGRPKWVDDDKGLAHIQVRMTEDSEPLFSTSVKMGGPAPPDEAGRSDGAEVRATKSTA